MHSSSLDFEGMKHTEMALINKKIIITRAQEQSSEAREILENGAQVFDLPSLVIGPPDDWAPLDEALKKISAF